MFALQLLQNRLDRINKAVNENTTIPLLDIERTYISFQNAHFRPFTMIGYESEDKSKIMEVTDTEQQRGKGLYQIIINDGRPRCPEKVKKIGERKKYHLTKQTTHHIKRSNKIKEHRQKNNTMFNYTARKI
jgi:hypothetical protein